MNPEAAPTEAAPTEAVPTEAESAEIEAIEHVVAAVERTLRPDVAAVKVRQVYHSAEGDTEGTPLYLMTRQDDGRWLLHVGQNTEVRML